MGTRLPLAKMLSCSVFALALVTGHSWVEPGWMDQALAVAGFSLLIVAMAGRIWCGSHIAGRKTIELVTDGPYSICRNPLYFFSLLAFVGAGLSFESLSLAAIFGAVFFLTHWRTIHNEERVLRERFGAGFDAYAARVPRLIPRPSLYHAEPFHNVGTVAFNRILREALLVPLVYLAAQGIEFAHDHGAIPVLLHLF
ncbi:MAG: methyltransferase family protein [Phycisphaerales bacterium]